VCRRNESGAMRNVGQWKYYFEDPNVERDLVCLLNSAEGRPCVMEFVEVLESGLVEPKAKHVSMCLSRDGDPRSPKRTSLDFLVPSCSSFVKPLY
jgi:hypothetical protein